MEGFWRGRFFWLKFYCAPKSVEKLPNLEKYCKVLNTQILELATKSEISEILEFEREFYYLKSDIVKINGMLDMK